MLSAVAQKSMSLSDMKEAAGHFRKMEALKRCFCRCTNTSWGEALHQFPNHANEDRLSQFIEMNFTKGVPESFQAYCQAAMSHSSSEEVDTYAHNDLKVFVIGHDPLTATHTIITNSGVHYNGFQLFTAVIPEVCSVLQCKMFYQMAKGSIQNRSPRSSSLKFKCKSGWVLQCGFMGSF